MGIGFGHGPLCLSGEAAVSNIISSTGNKMVVFMQLDLLDLKSVRKFADDVNKKEKKVDILVNNAGIARQPKVGYRLHSATQNIQAV